MIFWSSLAWIWSDTEAASLQRLGDCTSGNKRTTAWRPPGRTSRCTTITPHCPTGLMTRYRVGGEPGGGGGGDGCSTTWSHCPSTAALSTYKITKGYIIIFINRITPHLIFLWLDTLDLTSRTLIWSSPGTWGKCSHQHPLVETSGCGEDRGGWGGADGGSGHGGVRLQRINASWHGPTWPQHQHLVWCSVPQNCRDLARRGGPQHGALRDRRGDPGGWGRHWTGPEVRHRDWPLDRGRGDADTEVRLCCLCSVLAYVCETSTRNNMTKCGDVTAIKKAKINGVNGVNAHYFRQGTH